jgi:hypothetical protein
MLKTPCLSMKIMHTEASLVLRHISFTRSGYAVGKKERAKPSILSKLHRAML